jgi:hypothetical protein
MEVPHPYTATGKITGWWYIVVFIFLDNKWYNKILQTGWKQAFTGFNLL